MGIEDGIGAAAEQAKKVVTGGDENKQQEKKGKEDDPISTTDQDSRDHDGDGGTGDNVMDTFTR